MQGYRSIITILLVSILLLGPAEASLLSWLLENFWFLNPFRLLPGSSGGMSFKTSNNFGDTVPYDGYIPPFPQGINVKDATESKIYGTEYKVRIRQYRGKSGECQEEIMILWLDKPTGKTIYSKCQYGVSRRVEMINNLLLIGSPNENFCAFTTNKNEIYYLANGKWKKGAFNEDNTKDKELTSSEVSRIKQRISKWEEYLVKHQKEVDRLRDLKNVKRETRNKRKEELRGLLNKERENHRRIIDNIRQLRNDERTKHTRETQNIRDIRRKEGSSAKVDKLEAGEDRRHNAEEARLNQMSNDEDQRYNNEDKRYNALVNKEDSIYDEEIRKLEDLSNKEELRANKEFKEMISQGW